MVRLVPLQESIAVGASKLHAWPNSMVLFSAHTATGGVVSIAVTSWAQVVRLLQESMISQVRVAVNPQLPLLLVTVLRMLIDAPKPPQLSVTSGGLKLHTLPHSTVLFVAQVTIRVRSMVSVPFTTDTGTAAKFSSPASTIVGVPSTVTGLLAAAGPTRRNRTPKTIAPSGRLVVPALGSIQVAVIVPPLVNTPKSGPAMPGNPNCSTPITAATFVFQ